MPAKRSKGSTGRKTRQSGSDSTGSVPDSSGASASASPVESKAGQPEKPDSGTVAIPPTPSPGAPPKKRRGRKSNAEIEAEKKAAEIKAIAEEQAKRDKQATEIKPILSGSFKYLSRIMSEDDKVSKWAMTDAEADSIAGASAAVLAKYVDLDALNRWKEELALAVAVGSYVASRVTASEEPERETPSATPTL